MRLGVFFGASHAASARAEIDRDTHGVFAPAADFQGNMDTWEDTGGAGGASLSRTEFRHRQSRAAAKRTRSAIFL